MAVAGVEPDAWLSWAPVDTGLWLLFKASGLGGTGQGREIEEVAFAALVTGAGKLLDDDDDERYHGDGGGGQAGTGGGGKEVSGKLERGTFNATPTAGGTEYKFGCMAGGGGMCINCSDGSVEFENEANTDEVGFVEMGGGYNEPWYAAVHVSGFWLTDAKLADKGLDGETSEPLDVPTALTRKSKPTPIHDNGGNGGGGISATLVAVTVAVTGSATGTAALTDTTVSVAADVHAAVTLTDCEIEG